MKLNKYMGRSFVLYTLVLFAMFSLLSLLFTKTSFATADACNAEFSYWEDNYKDDSRILIDIDDYSGDDDRRVTIDPKGVYKIIFIGIDYSGNDGYEVTPSFGDGYTTIVYDAPNNESIDNVRVIVKKICASPTASSTPTATATSTATTAPTASPSPSKVYVCKYVGTPGVNERLQTGQNPIEVSVNAIPNGWSIGAYFSDQQGRSFVLATVPQNPEPDVDDCPQNSTPAPTATPVATATPTATSTATSQPCDGDCNEPTSTPIATETPNGDVCANIDGIQTSVPEGKHLDASGKNCVEFGVPGVPQPADSGIGGGQVLGTSTGQVLGTSTMAATGAVSDALFNSIFTLGSLLTSFGIMKNGKKGKN